MHLALFLNKIAETPTLTPRYVGVFSFLNYKKWNSSNFFF